MDRAGGQSTPGQMVIDRVHTKRQRRLVGTHTVLATLNGSNATAKPLQNIGLHRHMFGIPTTNVLFLF